MSETARLSTDRLVLRAGEESDAPAIAAFQRRNRHHFRPWDPRRPEAFFEEGFWRERVALDRESRERDQSYRYLLFERERPDRVVGFVHLSNVVRGAFYSCHLGFGIDEAHVGQGLMTEALERTVEVAFGPLRLHRLEANHRPENVRSGQVLKRLRFVPQGFARDYLFIDGAWRDHVLTARVDPSWRPG